MNTVEPIERKLLCVDDDVDILDMFRAMFSGFAVHTANSGKDGLEQLRKQKPGVVISDYGLTNEMRGVAFLAQARAQWPLSSRYFYTGNAAQARDKMTSQGVGLGETDLALDLFAKPENMDALVTAVTRGFERYERLTSMRVMIVDDEPSVATGVRRTLQDRGYQLVVYKNPIDAVAYLASPNGRDPTKPIAVLLTDMLMPHMDGADLSIRAREIDPNIGIVTFSGTQGFDINNRLYRKIVDKIGQVPCIPKPWRNSELQSIIDSKVINYHVASRQT